jgi:light-harvesting complex II chlorophyll a/b binding protein 7
MSTLLALPLAFDLVAPRGSARPGATRRRSGSVARLRPIGLLSSRSSSIVRTTTTSAVDHDDEESGGDPAPSPPSPDDAEAASASASASSPLGDLISSPLFYVTFGIVGGVAIVRRFENAALLLSAFPIVGLTLLSKTDFGANLERNILERRPALEALATERDARRAEARASSPLYGASRPLLVADPPRYLDGTLAGDYGFDPLGLASGGPEALDRAVELELLHARWAMLGVVGAAVPEALASAGALDIGEPVWWKVGAAKLNGDVLDYAGVGGFVIAGGQGVAVIALCQLVLMGGPEYARYVGIRSLEPVGVYLPGDKNYPGGAPFDPFGLSDDAERFEWQKVAEIKHGRLAMLATAGCAAQAIATRVGPVENLRDVAERVAETLGNR